MSILVARRAGERFGAFDPDLHLRIDFASLPVGRRQALRTVDESTIVSMFMNNRAAEYLVRGQIDDAYAHAREAVLQDATYAGAYNTLGVIYQRRGLTAAAERAYRATLALDDNHRSALLNLARLLERGGREAEAAPLQARLATLERDPPFAHFDRGVAAARAGQFALARDEIQREMKRDPDYHEFHFWLAGGAVRPGRRAEGAPAPGHRDEEQPDHARPGHLRVEAARPGRPAAGDAAGAVARGPRQRQTQAVAASGART